MVLEKIPAWDGAVAFTYIVELLQPHLLAEVIDVLAPLPCPVGSSVGVLLVGDTVEAHHYAIDVVTLSDEFDEWHEGVEIERSAHYHFLVLCATLAISEFCTVV